MLWAQIPLPYKQMLLCINMLWTNALSTNALCICLMSTQVSEPVPIHKGLFFYYPEHITPLALSPAVNDVV